MHGIFRKGRILILLLMAALMMICVSASGEEVSEEEAALFSLESVSIRELADITGEPSPEAESDDSPEDAGLPSAEPETDGEDEDNLLYNGRFELIDDDGLPESWFTDVEQRRTQDRAARGEREESA